MKAGKTKKGIPKAGKPKAKAAATVRSTSGAGFNFEDQVAAWLLLKMLRGEPIPGINASGLQIQMQTQAQGWDIDDLLITAKSETGEIRQLAVSCKGNVQVTSSGFPSDFISPAWNLWQKSEPYHRATDGVALATRGTNTDFNAIWSDIKSWCQDGNAEAALANINKSQKHKKVFMSVKEVATSISLTVTDSDTINLIRQLHSFPLGFQIEGSDQESNAIAQCRELLRNGSLQEATELWKAVIQRAEESRLRGGTIRLPELWRELGKKFSLREHPDFSSSWDALEKITVDYKEGIEASLPNGFRVPRTVSSHNLCDFLKENSTTVLYGNSGCGKSALVKSVLDKNFSEARQIWLGPEEIDTALSEAKRINMRLSHPLAEILASSARQDNIFVIDAAERLKPETLTKLKKLVTGLNPELSEVTSWKIIILGQTEAVDGRLQDISGLPASKFIEIGEILAEEAVEAIRSNDSLTWLASHEDAVATLRNLRALHEVMKAQVVFKENSIDSVSLTVIADRLWKHWTDNNAGLQNLLMRLAEKEASFERSFPLSEMAIEEAKAFNERPKHSPLRLNSRNRIEFEHDQASDWARFQRLKEISHDTARWAALAENPLWHSALRMLGQFLLRQPAAQEKTAWDVAFEEAEKSKAIAPLAADILLDALCLDPLAELFLTQRAEFLLADNGKRLNRLLSRFHHIATRPAIPQELLKIDPLLHLYLEAQHRIPIYGRWSGIANFLARHKDRVASLMSPIVAKLCETWLTTTPEKLSPETAMPYRKEFSEIAVASVRALQIEQGKGVWFLDKSEMPLYLAAFQAAGDLPEEVAQWALEMAQRRPYRKDIADALTEFNRRRAEDQAEKLKNDPKYREQQKRIRSMPSPIPSGRKLPPWPLGPRKRVERNFADCCTNSRALFALMKARPQDAAEILLASIIEDSPEEPYSRSSRIDFDLGLKYDHGSYPTTYWKSAFFQFLMVNTNTARQTLIQLVNFCTDRWEHEYGANDCPKIELNFKDGSKRVYKGDARVFDWAQNNSLGSGQLHCALDALEKWLCMQIDSGADISFTIDDLLQNCHSVSILGVLVNVGKYSPSLFSGPLRPLLGNADLYEGDNYRLQALPYHFDMLSWSRAGQRVFDIAREWVLAKHRQISLLQIVINLINSNSGIADFLKKEMKRWKIPEGNKQALEFKIKMAQLDAGNYTVIQNEAGQKELRFSYPTALEHDINAFENDALPKRQAIVLPYTCEKILAAARDLTDEEAAALAKMLSSIEGEEDANTKERALIAAASALTVKASAWLEKHSDALKQTENIIRKAISSIGDTSEDLRGLSFNGNPGLNFIAHAVIHKWIASNFSNSEWEEAIMRILTSRDKQASTSILRLAHDSRDCLGQRWYRLLQLGLLWSALSHLSPRYDAPPEIVKNWNRWLSRLRKFKISNDVTPAPLNPISLASRVERFENHRWERLQATKGKTLRFPQGRRFSGLDTYTLADMFSWLLDHRSESGTYDLEERDLVLALWKLEVWKTYEELDEDEDPGTSDQLSYSLVEALANIAAAISSANAVEYWKPVLEIGADAHYAIRHFLDAWFLQISRRGPTAEISKSWKNMLEYAMSAEKWISGRRWYYGHQLLRQLLGFHSQVFYEQERMQNLVLEMKDIYKRWVKEHLLGEEENIAGFCNFLSSKAGAVIRLEGLIWLKESFTPESRAISWRRDYTGSALVELLDTAMTENASEISKNPQVREAVVALIANLVARQIPAALPLQERVRRIAA